MEDSKPYTLEVLVEGIISEEKEVRKCNLPIKIGFGLVPEGSKALPHF